MAASPLLPGCMINSPPNAPSADVPDFHRCAPSKLFDHVGVPKNSGVPKAANGVKAP